MKITSPTHHPARLSAVVGMTLHRRFIRVPDCFRKNGLTGRCQAPVTAPRHYKRNAKDVDLQFCGDCHQDIPE